MDALRAFAWLGSSILAVIATLVLAFPFGTLVEGALGGGNAARLGGAAALWALLAAGAGALLGQAVLPSPHLNRTAVAGTIAGASIAAAVCQAGIVAWAEGRFGRWDPDWTSTSNLLTPAVVLLGVAAAAWLSTRSPARHIAFGLGTGMVVVVGLISASNVRGVFNGLSDVAWILVVGVGAAALYALGISAYVLKRRRMVARKR